MIKEKVLNVFIYFFEASVYDSITEGDTRFYGIPLEEHTFFSPHFA